MKASCIRFLLPIALFAGASLGHAQIIINNNTNAAGQHSYDFGQVVVSAFTGTNNSLINDANLNFLGVKGGNNANAIDDADGIFGGADQERLNLSLDSGYGLSQMSFQWSRTDGPDANDGVSVSGFLADPGVSFDDGGTYVTSPTYSAGVLNFQVSWTGGTVVTATFANLAASDGAVLDIVAADSDQGGAQLTPTEFQVALVPEPSTFALLGIGAAGLLIARRRLS